MTTTTAPETTVALMAAGGALAYAVVRAVRSHAEPIDAGSRRQTRRVS